MWPTVSNAAFPQYCLSGRESNCMISSDNATLKDSANKWFGFIVFDFECSRSENYGFGSKARQTSLLSLPLIDFTH